MDAAKRITRLRSKSGLILVFSALLLCVFGCGGTALVSPSPPPAELESDLASTGYSIQLGAFSILDNAVRLTQSLESQGVHAYYFVHPTGLYKVRFGDFPSREIAQRKAETLRAAGIIEEYYIIRPEDYAAQKGRKYGSTYLRKEIVKTARSFIGVPYRWGGSAANAGFDCSGLTMAVYQLNGLNLPRSSREQFSTGTPVNKSQLLRGDLVFFATSGPGRVSHVGVYAGRNRFVHAPGRGKRIRTDSLSNRYFSTRYVGARTYLR
ncbi:MAG: C40 family peptidase [Deltaproteobacteria bacterium]|nr:MAG: C40 family peptidase [Deltaproteobacteria bacterium]